MGSWGFFYATAVFAQTATQTGVLNIDGGVQGDYSDGLRILIGNNAEFQMYRCDFPDATGKCASNTSGGNAVVPGKQSGQMYPPNETPLTGVSNSFYLKFTDDTDTRIYSAHTDNFIFVSQSAVTGSGTFSDPYKIVTVVRPNAPGKPEAAVEFEITDTYVAPNSFFNRAFIVRDLPSTMTTRVYWYQDSYSDGSDSGNPVSGLTASGAWNTNLATGKIVTQLLVPGVLGWDHWHNGQYSSARAEILKKLDLSDYTEGSYVDVGQAVQWTVPAGAVTYANNVTPVYATGVSASYEFETGTIGLGETVGITVNLQNISNQSASLPILFSYDFDSAIELDGATLSNTCGFQSSDLTVSGPLLSVKSQQILQAGQQCTITFKTLPVRAAGSYGLSTPMLGFASVNQSVFNLSNAVLKVLASQPKVSYRFMPTATLVGGKSVLNILLDNSRNTQAAAAPQFVYTFDSALNLDASSLATSCPFRATEMTLNANRLTVAASGGLDAGTSCFITVNTGAIAAVGSYGQVSLDIVSGTVIDAGGRPLSVVASGGVTVGYRFNPSLIMAGEHSVLSLDFKNTSTNISVYPNLSYAFEGVSLENNGLSSTCPFGTTGISIESSVVNLALNTPLAPGQSCTIDIPTKTVSSPGRYTGSLSATQVSETAAQPLLVVPQNAATVSNLFSPDTILVDDRSRLRITVRNSANAQYLLPLFTYEFPSEIRFLPETLETNCNFGLSGITVLENAVTVSGPTRIPANSVCEISVQTKPVAKEGRYMAFGRQSANGAVVPVPMMNAALNVQKKAIEVPSLSPRALGVLALMMCLLAYQIGNRHRFGCFSN